MNELLAFKTVEFLVALGVVYGSYRIDKSTNSRSWELFSVAASILAVESIFQIYLITNGFSLGMLEGMFAPAVAVLITGAGLAFVNEYAGFGLFKSHHIMGYVVGVVGGSTALAFMAPAFMVSTAFYVSTPLLLLPAIYLFYRMISGGETAIFASLVTSAGLYMTSSMMNLYLASTGDAEKYVYSFIWFADLPKSQVVEFISTTAPVVKMSGTLFLGFSVYLFYHGVYRDIYSGEKDEDQGKELASNTVENIGAIIGKPLAGRMAKKALNEKFGKDEDSFEAAAEGEDVEEVAEALKTKFGESVGPVGEKKIEDLRKDIKGEE